MAPARPRPPPRPAARHHPRSRRRDIEVASVPTVTPRPGLWERVKNLMGIGPWNSNPGTYTGGPLAYTDSGWIPMNWPMNFGQVGYDPLQGGWNSVVYACVMRYAWTI